MENPIKMDDLGVPPFKETPTWKLCFFFFLRGLVVSQSVVLVRNHFDRGSHTHRKQVMYINKYEQIDIHLHICLYVYADLYIYI